VPVEVLLEFSAVISLNDVDRERTPFEDLFHGLDGRALVIAFEDFEDAQPVAVVNGGVLIEVLVRLRQRGNELHAICTRWPGIHCGDQVSKPFAGLMVLAFINQLWAPSM
jgi:hypothetical protein